MPEFINTFGTENLQKDSKKEANYPPREEIYQSLSLILNSLKVNELAPEEIKAWLIIISRLKEAEQNPEEQQRLTEWENIFQKRLGELEQGEQ